MHVELVFPAELFAAYLADETTQLSVVRLLMAVTVAETSKRFAAHGTLVRFLVVVDPLVSRQVTVLHEGHAAHLALKSQLARVNLFNVDFNKYIEKLYE